MDARVGNIGRFTLLFWKNKLIDQVVRVVNNCFVSN